MGTNDRSELDILEVRLKTLLPEEYQDSYEELQPTPMGSAGLKYDGDGRVAWDEIWGSFCDLAMAGGPPHKGALLQPATAADIDAARERYQEVVREICRGIRMVTDLAADPAPVAGWVRVKCLNEAMAGWLHRAITMENVAVRSEGRTLDLPAGPDYRLEKEIKNVITVIAKTNHYWTGHMWRFQRLEIGDLFEVLASESPLAIPVAGGTTAARLAEIIHARTGLRATAVRDDGWLGLECPNVRSAVWMMRALVANNVLSRREGTVLFVPIDPVRDPDGAIVADAVTRVHRLAVTKGYFPCQPPST
jgi:hypothetical protein